MNPEVKSKMPTNADLQERYKHLDHPGLERISNWGMPNSAKGTVDEEVEQFMAEDDANFFQKIDAIFE